MESTAATATPNNATNLTSISEMIRSKERELQKIQDLRTAQLEAMIEERDQLLLESSRRFEQLKDDFQYNLTLIEARDKEINRLEKSLEQEKKHNTELESQSKALLTRIDTMQLKEQERLERAEQDKAINKVRTAKSNTKKSLN